MSCWSPPRFVGQGLAAPTPRLTRDEPNPRCAPPEAQPDAAVFIGNLAPLVTRELLTELLVQVEPPVSN